MIFKILPIALLVGVGNSLYVDTAKAEDKGALSDTDNNWDFVKVYQNPPSHRTWYKYEPFAYPKYEFEYAVADKKTGDFKRHQESRDGDRVHGEYSLIEPDGSLRKVEYNADDHTGFNAIVSKGYQKHGEHAYSHFGHTRFFAPMSQGVKMNSYFTENMNSYNDKHNPIVGDKVKPVIEVPEEKKSITELMKPIVMNDLNGKMVILVPTESMGSVDSVSSSKPIDLPIMVPNDMANIVPMVMQVPSESPKTNNDDVAVNNSVEVEQSKPIVVAEKTEMVPDKTKETNQNEAVPDSNVASSYYHSRIYYGYS